MIHCSSVGRFLRLILAICLALVNWMASGSSGWAADERPNVLLAIADDWSWPHASAYGATFVDTPAFDRVARGGVLFQQAFCASPGCSPSRAALLTGRHTWQLEEAGTHASSFPSKYAVYPELLEAAGYHVGLTGKGWGPGNFKTSGRMRNPAGPSYDSVQIREPVDGFKGNDYAGNFEQFLKKRPEGKPFCFWYGGKEPHRGYDKGSGMRAGKRLEDVQVPPFLPDTPEVRSDLLDYALEIEWFNRHLGRMLKMLDDADLAKNTLIIVVSDNGMPFPRAKANVYEFGIHMPMAVRWPARVKAGRRVDDLVGHIDLAPTILQACGVAVPREMTGKSLLPILTSDEEGQVDPARTRVFAARERHSSSRVDNLGYPCRALRTHEHLYILNFAADRWPAGDPRGVENDRFGYYDIDGSPTKTLMVLGKDQENIAPLLRLAVDKRPAEELYLVKVDPGCVTNVAQLPKYANVKQALKTQLMRELTATGDPRASGNGEIFESYPRYSPIRTFE
jgi:uncharacterized sulfatase